MRLYDKAMMSQSGMLRVEDHGLDQIQDLIKLLDRDGKKLVQPGIYQREYVENCSELSQRCDQMLRETIQAKENFRIRLKQSEKHEGIAKEKLDKLINSLKANNITAKYDNYSNTWTVIR